jgi:formylglycine-generating enzyme
MSRAQGNSKFMQIISSFLIFNLICSVTLSITEHPQGLTEQVSIPSGHFYFGTQMQIDDRFMAYNPKDGGKPRKKKVVKAFFMDIDCVTNAQFKLFVEETGYETEAEKFKWSFVLEHLASSEVIEEADSGLGRVQNAKEWVAVKRANWKHPHGPDTSVRDFLNYPVVQVSHLAYFNVKKSIIKRC